MDEEGSVTRIIRRMQSGDANGADLLWNRFYARLKHLVKDRLHSRLQAVSDEEDVALDTLAELFQGLLNGKYPGLDNRRSVWRLLVTVASRNVLDEIKKGQRLKRGGGRVYNESALNGDDDQNAGVFARMPSSGDAPDVQVMIAERCTEMLESLEDETLQAIALLKTSGSSNQEVADALGLSLRSVERRLQEIRARWKTC